MRQACIIIGLLLAATIGLSAQSVSEIEDELLGHFDKLAKASNYGPAEDYETLGRENKAIRKALLKYGSRSDVLSYRFARLAERLTLTTSKDGRLRTYSWDSEEGGTMHDFYTVFQYQGKSGKVHAWSEPYTQSLEDRGAGAFVQDIFQLVTKERTIYVTVSTFIGSTSISGQVIEALTIEGERLNRKPRAIRTAKGFTDSISFEYDFFSVVDHPERPIKLVFFDEGKRLFRFPVVIVDEETPQGRVTNSFITYKFNGKYFVKTV